MKQKNIVIGIMCIVVCIMAIGFAAFSTTLNISGTSSIESNWSVVFMNIQELSKTNGVTINNAPSASGTTATFDISLESPGDSIEYQITVANQGTLDAIIEDIETTETENSALLFEVSGINKGDKLAKSTQTTFNIKISYDSSVTSQPEELNKTLTINITYVQDVGQAIEPDLEPTLVNAILRDNEEQADTGIDFSKTSEEDGTKGLYYTSTNTEDNKTTYYFRGAVENNYVSFAGFYWRIIRINEDSSIRLIYQGTTPNATNDAATIGESAFNSNSDDNAYIGYMYGEVGSSSYSATHANTNDSTIKGVLDSWYENNLLTNYSSYLADAGFCGDRSLSSGTGIGTNETSYGAYNRLVNEYQPQFACPQNNDLYTTNSSTKGNKALEYPIGLITLDEVMYAGGYANINESYYLYTGYDYWTMSPWYFDGSNASGCYVPLGGALFLNAVHFDGGARPVINLKSGIEITGGDGTSSNPYIIKTN